LGEAMQKRADSVRFDALNRLIRPKLAQIHPTPATQQGQRAVVGNLVEILIIFSLSFGFRTTRDYFQIGVTLNVVWLASVGSHKFTNVRAVFAADMGLQPNEKTAFRVFSGKLMSAG
jgi:hypothetical protein